MKKELFRLAVLLMTVLGTESVRAETPETTLGRLYTVETAVSVYGNGDGTMLWIEDLRRLEAVWHCLSPQTQAGFRDFLLPVYMREIMGIPLFEETDGAEEWTDLAEKFLFDSPF